MLGLFFSLFYLLLLILGSSYSWSLLCCSLMLMSLFFFFSVPVFDMNIFWWGGYLDLLSVVLIVLSLWISALMIISSQKIYFSKNNISGFLGLVLVLCIILIFSFCTSNMVMFYIFFEGSLLPTLLLVLGWGYQPERLQAGVYLMLYTITASLPLLFSIMLINSCSYNLSFILPVWNFFYCGSQLGVWWVITIGAFLVKTPMFLVHLWLPKAHVEAPVAGSMILAGLLLKLGGYGLVRMSSFFIFLNMKVSSLLISISLVGGVITSFICLRQVDLKSLIAYSSVSHMGMVTSGIMSNTAWGWHGALVMMLAHGLCSSGLFSLANMNYETTQTRSIFITKGLMSFFPAMCFWWFLFSACNMAAPPFMNLLGEIILIASVLSFSFYSCFLLGMLSFMAAAYSLFLFTSTQYGVSPSFSNVFIMFYLRNYSICLFHMAPLFLLVIKSDLISLWF